MPASVRSYALCGVDAVPVTVTVDILQRLPSLVIAGLPGASVRESADRVRSAITAAGFHFPRARVVVEVACKVPASGTALDLPIAVAILAATGQLPESVDLGRLAFYGELSLSGDVRCVRGSLAARLAAYCEQRVLVVSDHEHDGAPGGSAIGLGNLREVVDGLRHWQKLPLPDPVVPTALDFRDVRGRLHAVDAFVEAARTGRPLLLVGPPGCGKTMLAARFAGILPDLTAGEAQEVARIGDAAGLGTASERPFRAPHHTVSVAGLLGNQRPGEATLAHRGVLFLDEIAEFPRAAIEALRAPVADKAIRIARSWGRTTYPADFRLIAATNPCPCGYHGTSRCRCPEEAVKRYAARVADNPLLRDAIRVVLAPVPPGTLLGDGERWPSTAKLQARVLA